MGHKKKEITFDELDRFLVYNKDNDEMLFITYHDGYIPPKYRELYEQFRKDMFNNMATHKKYGNMYETFLYWHDIDTRNNL